MNNQEAKKKRKEYRKIAYTKGKTGNQIFQLARKRDILGIILILENLLFVILFLIFVLL